MAKKRSSRVATKRKTKKKSWWSFFFVLAIATVIGLPITYNMTKSSSQVASNGNSKVAGDSSIYVKSITADAGSCAGQLLAGAKTDSTQKVAGIMGTPYPIQPGFETIRFTCTNGKAGGLTNSGGCFIDLSTAAKKAQEACGSLGGTTTPTPAPSTYPKPSPTPTISINYPVTPTTSGVACSGSSPSGKILICFISTCASKGLKTYAPANSYCTGLGKTNCCEW